MFILSEQLDADGDPHLPFRLYTEYLERNRSRFPAAAYDLASGPLLDASDRNCPHDGWLAWAKLEKPSQGERHEVGRLDFRLRLLGAYHDRYIELFYPKVFSYAISNLRAGAGRFDWRYSEIRLSDQGNVVHEIEWAGPPGLEARWLIEASDVHIETILLADVEQHVQAGAAPPRDVM